MCVFDIQFFGCLRKNWGVSGQRTGGWVSGVCWTLASGPLLLCRVYGLRAKRWGQWSWLCASEGRWLLPVTCMKMLPLLACHYCVTAVALPFAELSILHLSDICIIPESNDQYCHLSFGKTET